MYRISWGTLAANPTIYRLRGDTHLYTGLYDCVKTIVREEGWGVLYRGWFLTFLGNLIPALRDFAALH